MRAFVIGAAVIALTAVGASQFLTAHPEFSPMDTLQEQVQLPAHVRSLLAGIHTQHAVDLQRASAPAVTEPTAIPRPRPSLPPPSATQVTLYLPNGGAVTGELVKETPTEIYLQWEDAGQLGFQRDEILRIVKGSEGILGDGLVMPWEQGTAPSSQQ